MFSSNTDRQSFNETRNGTEGCSCWNTLYTFAAHFLVYCSPMSFTEPSPRARVGGRESLPCFQKHHWFRILSNQWILQKFQATITRRHVAPPAPANDVRGRGHPIICSRLYSTIWIVLYRRFHFVQSGALNNNEIPEMDCNWLWKTWRRANNW